MKYLTTIAILAAAAAATAHARLGESVGQSQLRYGQPREDLAAPGEKPLMPGSLEKTYEYQGWRVRSAFVNGICHRIEYAHIPTDGQPKQINEGEMKAILEAEKGKFAWKEEKSKVDNDFKGIEAALKAAFKVNKWQRTDKAKAELQLGLLLKLETRDAEDFEKKLAKQAPKQPQVPGVPKNVPKF